MKWILIGIFLSLTGEHASIEIERYDSMEECFVAREKVILSLGFTDGIPIHSQFVCIPLYPLLAS